MMTVDRVHLSLEPGHASELAPIPLLHSRPKLIGALTPPSHCHALDRRPHMLAADINFDTHIAQAIDLEHGGTNDELNEIVAALIRSRGDAQLVAEIGDAE